MKLKLSTLGVTAGLFVAAITAGSLHAQTTNSLTVANFSFESPVVGGQTIFDFGAGSSSYLTGWNVNSGMIMALDVGAGAQNGNQYLEAFAYNTGGYNGSATISQILTNNFVMGDTYIFSLYTQGSHSGDSISINDGGTILASTNITSGGSWGLTTVSFTNISNTDPISISINAVGQASNISEYFDNATVSQVSAVPEPSTWALFGVAMFCGLVFRHKLARKNA